MSGDCTYTLSPSFDICSGSQWKPFIGQAKVFTHGANTSSQVSEGRGGGGGAIIQAMVSKAPPLQKQADSVAHGLFTLTSVNPDCNITANKLLVWGLFQDGLNCDIHSSGSLPQVITLK